MSSNVTLGLTLIAGLVVTGCGPVVTIDGGGEGSTTTSATAASNSMGNDGNPSVPPNTTPTAPTSTTSPLPPETTAPATTTPPVSTTAPPTECVPGEVDTCVCPRGLLGERECSAAGTYGRCECESTSWDSSGTSTGWGTSGSGGNDDDTFVPDLPPGETCLPLDLPCTGFFQASTASEVESFSTCSRVEGDVVIQGDLVSAAPLSCLREVTGVLAFVETTIVELDQLTALEEVEALAFADNVDLVDVNIPTLASVTELFVVNNASLTGLSFPSLTQISDRLEVFGNPLLPDCVIGALADQASPGMLNCEQNLPDMCTGVCD